MIYHRETERDGHRAYLQLVLARLSLRGRVKEIDCENLETIEEEQSETYRAAETNNGEGGDDNDEEAMMGMKASRQPTILDGCFHALTMDVGWEEERGRSAQISKKKKEIRKKLEYFAEIRPDD